MDIRKYFAKKDDKTAPVPAKKKPAATSAADGVKQAPTTLETSTTSTTTECSSSKKRPSSALVSNKKQQTQQQPSKAAIKKRRKWLKEGMCFVCHDIFDKDELEPCQCFHEANGVKGFGMVFCQDCDDDDDGVAYCSGPCGARLCFRSCEYSRCAECEDVCCQKCIDSNDCLNACVNCDKMYCKSCIEDVNSVISRCAVCKKDSCNACDKTIQMCDFCSEMICDKCLDKRQDRIEGRSCVSCFNDSAEDMRHENAMICRYGGDYERYM